MKFFKHTSKKSIDLLKDDLKTQYYVSIIDNTTKDNKTCVDDLPSLFTDDSDCHYFEIDKKIDQIENELMGIKRELKYDKCSKCCDICIIQ